MYEVEQSTDAKLKQQKRGSREKTYLDAGKERQPRTQTSKAHRASGKKINNKHKINDQRKQYKHIIFRILGIKKHMASKK